MTTANPLGELLLALIKEELEDYSLSRRDELIAMISDDYKDLNGFRPRLNWDTFSDEDLEKMYADLRVDYEERLLKNKDDRDWDMTGGNDWDDWKAEEEQKILQRAEKAEDDKNFDLDLMPKSGGMRRTSMLGLKETAPPGKENLILKLKKQYGEESDMPYKIAWSQYNKEKEAKKPKTEAPVSVPKPKYVPGQSFSEPESSGDLYMDILMALDADKQALRSVEENMTSDETSPMDLKVYQAAKGMIEKNILEKEKMLALLAKVKKTRVNQ